MKTYMDFIFIALLTGCVANKYANIAQSQAVISNLTVVELGEAGSNMHQLDVTFDYTINSFSPTPNLYTCSVLFATSNGNLVSALTEQEICNIESATGSISINSQTPLSSSAYFMEKHLRNMELPLKYHVSIHQNTDKRRSVIIGMSEALYLADDN